MSDFCVVHLVRKGNPAGALQRFVDSYRRHVAGESHELLIVFKGFSNAEDRAVLNEMLVGTRYSAIDIPDRGFDIDAYWSAFNESRGDSKYYLFLNSHAEILHDNWLGCFSAHIEREGVGLLGATGSYQSIASDCRYPRYLEEPVGSVWRALMLRVGRPTLGILRRRQFPMFPNPHIRSNAFMVSSEVMGRVPVKRMKSKMDCYKFESGNHSLTRQVQAMGLMPLLVDAAGCAYRVDDWWKSNVFWRGNQENLLIADNQTRAYESGDVRKKAMLSHYAWGNHGQPTHEDIEMSTRLSGMVC